MCLIKEAKCFYSVDLAGGLPVSCLLPWPWYLTLSFFIRFFIRFSLTVHLNNSSYIIKCMLYCVWSSETQPQARLSVMRMWPRQDEGRKRSYLYFDHTYTLVTTSSSAAVLDPPFSLPSGSRFGAPSQQNTLIWFICFIEENGDIAHMRPLQCCYGRNPLLAPSLKWTVKLRVNTDISAQHVTEEQLHNLPTAEVMQT